jgi:hypothetical protein
MVDVGFGTGMRSAWACAGAARVVDVGTEAVLEVGIRFVLPRNDVHAAIIYPRVGSAVGGGRRRAGLGRCCWVLGGRVRGGWRVASSGAWSDEGEGGGRSDRASASAVDPGHDPDGVTGPWRQLKPPSSGVSAMRLIAGMTLCRVCCRVHPFPEDSDVSGQ